MNDNCLHCMFSEYTEFGIMFNDLTNSDYMKCNHENSPYYNETVSDKYTCHHFLDSKKYFNKKDRMEKLNKLNDLK